LCVRMLVPAAASRATWKVCPGSAVGKVGEYVWERTKANEGTYFHLSTTHAEEDKESLAAAFATGWPVYDIALISFQKC
jgi:hypothetical protein